MVPDAQVHVGDSSGWIEYFTNSSNDEVVEQPDALLVTRPVPALAISHSAGGSPRTALRAILQRRRQAQREADE